MGNGFYHSVNNDFGVKGLGDGNHLSHKIGSDEFHLTTPIKIDGIGTVKIRDYFDTNGNFKYSKFGFTNKE